MTRYVALLRGVNVGGHKKVAMADLRELARKLGLKDVDTLLNSGNLVFGAEGKTAAQLEKLLAAETKQRLGLETVYLVRSAEEWRGIVTANPFPAEATADPGHLVVMCLQAAPGAAAVAALQAGITGPEVVRAAGRAAYITYPAGQGTSKLTNAVIEKALGTRGSARNWNTVLKLDALVNA